MAPSAKTYPHGLKVAVTVILLSSTLSCLPSKSVGLQLSSYGKRMEESEMVLGSRPPGCVNKCMSCRPCMATLVIPPHHVRDSSHGQDDSYYLLSWKCRCGDKLYQP
ncbi:unnamed protein product [Camellia sinensis]|uniref:EPIDERMAL PATTERNING FACTOR-like protein 8 n=1 Tax=Camellia sinensis TaxID=4442 RepID=UPI0010366829|nr:EPIDERMAL PATTERNING FACTOR-like protein 8 [Camellia sinensis]